VILNVVAPLLVNGQALDYYRYFITNIMPQLIGFEIYGRYNSYSLISTVSYFFKIQWWPPLKMMASGIATLLLLIPPVVLFRKSPDNNGYRVRLSCLASIITIIPLTFPMSEAHHLVILAIPLILIIEYWQSVWQTGGSLFRDRLSIILIASLLLLLLGRPFRPNPLLFMGLAGLYWGVLLLFKQYRDATVLSQK
ncbi:MAG: hypothetical protein ACREBV_07810, partial [Candidatus Zixiibacteriota bacterium]